MKKITLIVQKLLITLIELIIFFAEFTIELEKWLNNFLKSNITLLSITGIFATVLSLLYQVNPNDKNQASMLVMLQISFIGLLILNIFVLVADTIRNMYKDNLLSPIYFFKILFITLWESIAISFGILGKLQINNLLGKNRTEIYSIGDLYIICLCLFISNIIFAEIVREHHRTRFHN